MIVFVEALTMDLKLLSIILAIFGGLAGIYYFFRLVWRDGKAFLARPRMKIAFDPKKDLRDWNFTDTGWKRTFATVHVSRKGKKTAERCVPIVEVISLPEGVQLVERQFSVHWAGVDYSGLSSGAEAVDIGPELRRLDIAFSRNDANKSEGAWIAIPIALISEHGAGQAYLAPGDYTIRLTIECENGKADSKTFKLISPRVGHKLLMEEIEHSRKFQ